MTALVLGLLAALIVIDSASAQSDVTPPVVVQLTITPTLMDTSAGPQTITFTAHITDDLSGLRYQTIVFGPLLYGSDQDKAVLFNDASLVSGTLTDGTFVATVTLPQYSADGRWIAKYMYGSDQVGNQADCYTNTKTECPPDWRTYYFVNIRDVVFLYLSFVTNSLYLGGVTGHRIQ